MLYDHPFRSLSWAHISLKYFHICARACVRVCVCLCACVCLYLYFFLRVLLLLLTSIGTVIWIKVQVPAILITLSDGKHRKTSILSTCVLRICGHARQMTWYVLSVDEY